MVEEAIRRTPGLRRSRSYTSRRARPGESDGVDYNFVSRARFEAMRAGDQFLEWAEYSGNLYGTAQVDTERALAEGDDLVLVIDVQGGRKIRDRGWPALYVFLLPPSFGELEARLRSRQGDSEEQIQQRLAAARVEVAAASEYDYVLINETVEACVERLRAIVLSDRRRRMGGTGGTDAAAEALAEAARRDAMAAVVAPILAGFAQARS